MAPNFDPIRHLSPGPYKQSKKKSKKDEKQTTSQGSSSTVGQPKKKDNKRVRSESSTSSPGRRGQSPATPPRLPGTSALPSRPGTPLSRPEIPASTLPLRPSRSGSPAPDISRTSSDQFGTFAPPLPLSRQSTGGSTKSTGSKTQAAVTGALLSRQGTAGRSKVPPTKAQAVVAAAENLKAATQGRKTEQTPHPAAIAPPVRNDSSTAATLRRDPRDNVRSITSHSLFKKGGGQTTNKTVSPPSQSPPKFTARGQSPVTSAVLSPAGHISIISRLRNSPPTQASQRQRTVLSDAELRSNTSTLQAPKSKGSSQDDLSLKKAAPTKSKKQPAAALPPATRPKRTTELDPERLVWWCCVCLLRRDVDPQANEMTDKFCVWCRPGKSGPSARCNHPCCARTDEYPEADNKCVTQKANKAAPLFLHKKPGRKFKDIPWGRRTPFTYKHFRPFENTDTEIPYRWCCECIKEEKPYCDTPVCGRFCNNPEKLSKYAGRNPPLCRHEPCEKCIALPPGWPTQNLIPEKAEQNASNPASVPSVPMPPAPQPLAHWYCHHCSLSGHKDWNLAIQIDVDKFPHKVTALGGKHVACGHRRYTKLCSTAATPEELGKWS